MINNESIAVIQVVEHADISGVIDLHCTMTDGSIWICDAEGSNWRKWQISNDELTNKFRDFLSVHNEKDK